jgi:hypothetical protein
VAYVRVWESLGDTVKRVISSGVKAKEAKTDLCHAIADREIGIRLKVTLADTFTVYRQMVVKAQGLGSSADALELFEGANVKVPSDLQPNDFDWKKSRPRKPWPIRPYGARRDEWKLYPHFLIELRTAEVLTWIQRTYRNANKEAERPTTTTSQESNAIKDLALHLRDNAKIRRADAAEWCNNNGFSLGKRPFGRVWPEARKAAGLSAIAPPGRKRKSSR